MIRTVNTAIEDNRYAYAVAYIRALEEKSLTSQTVTQLLEVEGGENLLGMLQGTEYEVDSLETFERKLREELDETIYLVRKLSLDAALEELLTLKYDFYNLKVLLMAKHSAGDVEPVLVDGGLVSAGELRHAINEDRMCNLPEGFENAIREAEAEFENEGELRAIDVVLDREFADIFYRVSSEYGRSFFIGFLSLFVDLSNIKVFFRAHNLGKEVDFFEKGLLDHGSLDKSLFSKPGEEFVSQLPADFSSLFGGSADYRKEEQSTARIERLADEYLLRFLKSTRYIVFGPEVLFTYLMVKENELRTIRTIVLGKVNAIPVDMIKERIVFS